MIGNERTLHECDELAAIRSGSGDGLAWAMAGPSGPDLPTARRVLHDDDTILIEDSARDAASPLGAGHSSRHQVAFPYFGAFEWKVGREHRLVDANTILFVTGGQEFLEKHPNRHIGHGSIIMTPSDDLLDEMSISPVGESFSAVTRPMSDTMRLDVSRLLFADLGELEREELALGLLRAAAGNERRIAPSRPVVQRAKQVLHEHGFEPLSLSCIARRVGVSPIYLTQSFTRSEGMPLYRYQMRLRLSRALFELPRCDNLIELALDLGFSSHSHFTSTFRSVFATTPSDYRSKYRYDTQTDRNIA